MAVSRCTIIATACVLLVLSVNGILTQADSLETCSSLASAPKQEKYKALLAAAKAIENEIIDIRRTLHRRPAIMYEEYEAQALVIETLTKLGLRYVINELASPTADHNKNLLKYDYYHSVFDMIMMLPWSALARWPLQV